MAIFSKKSKAKKEAEKTPAPADDKPKPQPYRHIPTHAASDAVGQGTSDKEKDRAQIAVASQRRIQNAQFDSALGNAAYTQSIAHSMAHGMPTNSMSFTNSQRRLYNPMFRNQSQEVFTTDPDAPPMPQSPALSMHQSQSRSGSRNPSRRTSMTRVASDYFSQIPVQARAPESPTLGSLKPTSSREQGYTNPHYSTDSGYESNGISTAVHSRASSEQNSDEGSKQFLPRAQSGFLPELSLTEEIMNEPAFSEHSFSEDQPLELAPRPKPHESALKSPVGYVSKLDPASDVKKSSTVSKKTRFLDETENAQPRQHSRQDWPMADASHEQLPANPSYAPEQQRQQAPVDRTSAQYMSFVQQPSASLVHIPEQPKQQAPADRKFVQHMQPIQQPATNSTQAPEQTKQQAPADRKSVQYVHPVPQNAASSIYEPEQPTQQAYVDKTPLQHVEPVNLSLPQAFKPEPFAAPASRSFTPPPQASSEPKSRYMDVNSYSIEQYQPEEVETPRAINYAPNRQYPQQPHLDRNVSIKSSRRASMPPLSILDGLKVNRRGLLLDEEGDAVGELVEGSLIDCVRQKANSHGEILDEYGSVVGVVRTIIRPAESIRSSSPNGTYGHRSQYSEDTTMSSISPVSTRRSLNYQPLQQQYFTQQLHSHVEDPQSEEPRGRQMSSANAQPMPQWSRQSAVAPMGTDNAFTVELDGSGHAEAAPIIDHSDIFCPPFVPPRSPKRGVSPVAVEHKTAPSPARENRKTRDFTAAGAEGTTTIRQQMQQFAQQDAPRRPVRPVAERSLSDLSKSYARPSMTPVPENNVPPQDRTSGPEAYAYKGDIPQDSSAQQAILMRSKSPAASTRKSYTGPSPVNPYGMPKTGHLSVGAGAMASRRATTQFTNGLQPMRPGVNTRNSLHAPLKRSPLSSHEATPNGSDEGDETANPDDVRQSLPSGTRSRSNSNRTTHSVATTSDKPRNYFTHAGRIHVPAGELPPPTTALPVPPAVPESAAERIITDDGKSTKSSIRKGRFNLRFGRKSKVAAA